jgi:hypothetical protein
MLHLEIIHETFATPVPPLAYLLYADPFCDILQETVKNLNHAEIPCHEIISNFITKLEALNTQMINEDIDATPISSTILDALRQLQTASQAPAPQNHRLLMQDVAKIISQCEFVGIKAYTFTPKRGQTNPQRLAEINFPEALIPEQYLCQIQDVIMSLPYHQPGVGLIDLAAAAMHGHQHGNQDMVTREQMPSSFETDEAIQDLSHKIELFIKKAQLVYLAFQANDAYNSLYQNEAIKAGLQDEALSYEDFRVRVQHIASTRQDPAQALSVFTAPENKTGLLPVEIFKLFVNNKIRVFQPKTADYELLIRRLAAQGSFHNLETLLSSPIFDVVSINLDTQSSNGLSALTWTHQQAEKFPEKASSYAECGRLLERFKEAHAEPEAFVPPPQG